ncbi:MAG: ABC transporter permease [Gemmatimonadaceae bacterium]|nr:ABC transporter permease [Gemmatimonadaceae bacterium]MDQ3242967.1 ABC transporter permease [Gemmatimonadota bacterium]
MNKLELSIAWRYLRSRRGSRLLSLISVIAIGGVLVGVSALILIIGVMNGLQRDLREKILVGSPDIRVLSYGEDLKITDWQSVLGKVKQLPGVVAAAPFVLVEGGMNAGHDYAGAAMVVGIPPAGRGVPEVTTVRQHAVSGDFRFASSDGQRNGVVLGKLLASRYNAWPGDKINLISIAGVKPNAVTGGFVPRVFQFEVTGIVETGMYEYDNAYVFVAIDKAQEFAALGDGVTGIEVRTVDRWQAGIVSERITAALGWPYRTVDWQEQNRSLFQALKLEKLGMGVILLLIVMVAAFNIVSTLTMVVTDKTREIGILKAMGLPSRSIRRIFLAQGVVIGVVGTLLGLIVGFGGAIALERYKFIPLDPAIYFIDHLPVATQPRDVAWIILASVLTAAIATLYPAIQASRLYPIDAIRHE